MAITNCPACSKRISDKAKICPFCDFGIGSATDEDIMRKANMKKFQKKHSLQNQSMMAMLLFIAGFGFMYWGGAKPGEPQHTAAIGCSVVGFIWYIINRIRMIFLKKAD